MSNLQIVVVAALVLAALATGFLFIRWRRARAPDDPEFDRAIEMIATVPGLKEKVLQKIRAIQDDEKMENLSLEQIATVPGLKEKVLQKIRAIQDDKKMKNLSLEQQADENKKQADKIRQTVLNWGKYAELRLNVESRRRAQRKERAKRKAKLIEKHGLHGQNRN